MAGKIIDEILHSISSHFKVSIFINNVRDALVTSLTCFLPLVRL